MCGLTLRLPYATHQDYDNFFFYFAYLVVRKDDHSFYVHLMARSVRNPEDGPIVYPPPIAPWTVPTQSIALVKKALLVRKYLCIMVAEQSYDPNTMKKEWREAPDASFCWNRSAN